MSRCAYIFLDEAGNLDFSHKGTRYFVLTSVSMRRPFPIYGALNDYKHDCLEYGLDMEYFHCADDNRYVRDGVFNLIGEYLGGIRNMASTLWWSRSERLARLCRRTGVFIRRCSVIC